MLPLSGAEHESQFLAVQQGDLPGGQTYHPGSEYWKKRFKEKKKPELRAPASGTLACYWGWKGITAWRGSGGLPA